MEMIERLTERAKAMPGNFWESVGGAAAPILIVLASVTVVSILAWLAIRLRPRRRVGYALVPDPSFDPSLEEITRWSLGLAEARAAVGFGTNSHKMVRLTICSDDQGNLVSLIGLNPRARSVAERNGYNRIDLADPAEVLGELAPTWLPPSATTVDPADQQPPPEPDRVQDTLVIDAAPTLALSGSESGAASRWENAL